MRGLPTTKGAGSYGGADIAAPVSKGLRSAFVVSSPTYANVNEELYDVSFVSSHESAVQMFLAKPPLVLFTVYSVGQVYEVRRAAAAAQALRPRQRLPSRLRAPWS